MAGRKFARILGTIRSHFLEKKAGSRSKGVLRCHQRTGDCQSGGAMTQIYQSFAIEKEDSLDERMRKLYLGIISIGEDLYCKGSHLSELNKQINTLDAEIARMRREYEELKRIVRVEEKNETS